MRDLKAADVRKARLTALRPLQLGAEKPGLVAITEAGLAHYCGSAAAARGLLTAYDEGFCPCS
jgi:hypothetical protein